MTLLKNCPSTIVPSAKALSVLAISALALSALQTLAIADLGSTSGNDHSRLHVDTERATITVQSNSITAAELARELGLKLEINVVITGDENTQLDLDIVEENLDSAIGKISPNHLLVRQSADPASPIVEIVMMMAESGSPGATADGNEFLPTGTPLPPLDPLDDMDTVISDRSMEVVDPALLRDPDRTLRVREATSIADYNASLPPEQMPAGFAQDTLPAPDTIELYQQQ